MTIRKALFLATFCLSALGFSNTSVANADQANVVFSEGSVLIRCSSGQEISDDLFKAAFPDWMARLQKHANAGLVKRAHYLGRLKEGIFIVVAGESRDQAGENAKTVMADLAAIAQKAVDENGLQQPVSLDETCQTSEIGPVAILPIK